MKALPKDCPATIDHAMIHLSSALENLNDEMNEFGEDDFTLQIKHDLFIVRDILSILLRGK